MAFPVAGAFTKWPNGSGGDLTVATNAYLDFTESTEPRNYRNVTINAGSTLWIRVIDGYPAIIGVAGNLTVNGSIRVVDKFTDSQWPLSTVRSRNIPSLNNQTFSWTTPPARTGGDSGYGPGSKGFGWGGRGGLLLIYLGGDGGNYNTNGNNGSKIGDGTAGLGGTNATIASNGGQGSGTVGGNGGGRFYDNQELGGSGSGPGGGGGGAGVRTGGIPNFQGAGGGGGSGGWPGRNGAALYLVVRGTTTGSGQINLSGEVGRLGFNGGSSPTGSAGSGGGGGAGGYGGNLFMRHNGIVGVTTAVSGAAGGAGGINPDGGQAGSGSSGTSGTTNISAA